MACASCSGGLADPGPGTAPPDETRWYVDVPGKDDPERFEDLRTAQARAVNTHGVVRQAL